jgi:hypothetical protein
MGTIKTVGSSGQISLGKKFAGQTVMIDEIQAGVWIVKLGRFVPNSEKWLYRPDVQAELNEAISWANGNGMGVGPRYLINIYGLSIQQ